MVEKITFQIATLWLSAMLVLISGLLCGIGYFEHKKSIEILENIINVLFNTNTNSHEGTDAD